MNAPVVRLRVANATYERRLDQSFPGYFQGAKHNHYADFGFPTQLAFVQFHAMYQRNSLARAAVDKTVAKTWESFPFLLEKPRDAGQARKETRWEKLIRERFDDLRVWQQLAEADRRGLVGAYAGVILRLADGRKFDQPVKKRVPGGLMGLVEVIPAWEGQLTVSNPDTDETSPTYGQPLMFQFNESAVGENKQPRSFQVHPDRVVIWSRDGTVNGSSALEPGYNDLMTIEKVVGGGGQGFWKNAKSAPILEMDKEIDVSKLAQGSGMTVEAFMDALDEHIEAFNQGFDKYLMTQGIVAKALQINLPSPEHFFSIAAQSFAASMLIPMKILVGMQTGERASTEDADEWAQTNMARRASYVIPNIMGLVRRLERFAMIPERDWSLSWADLTEPKAGEKIDRAVKMIAANKASADGTGERVFTIAEVRSTAGDYEPLSAQDAKVEKPEPEQPDPQGGPDPAETEQE